jgi:hypothetical protein
MAVPKNTGTDTYPAWVLSRNAGQVGDRRYHPRRAEPNSGSPTPHPTPTTESRTEPSGGALGMIGDMTMTTGTGHEPEVNDRAAMQAQARQQVRQVAARWLTGDGTAALGQQMVLSITRYREANRLRRPGREALAGVDPALCEPMTTVPVGRWPRRCGGGSYGSD